MFRTSEPQGDVRFNKDTLKSIKVMVRRRNVDSPISSAPLQRSLDDPVLLKIHYRSGKQIFSI
jgi:hypothetical protein